MFDTKIAILIHPDLEVWQKLNVTAFLSSGIAHAVPEAMGDPYVDGAGRGHAALLGQPIMVFAAEPDLLCRAWDKAIARDLIRAGYVRGMFGTGHDAANREVFAAEPVDTPDLVGIAIHGPRRDVDKVIKGAKLHP